MLLSDEKQDVLTFDPKDQDVYNRAIAMTKEQQKLKKFTNTASFKIKCELCGGGFVGAKEAADHAKETGHANFVQY